MIIFLRYLEANIRNEDIVTRVYESSHHPQADTLMVDGINIITIKTTMRMAYPLRILNI